HLRRDSGQHANLWREPVGEAFDQVHPLERILSGVLDLGRYPLPLVGWHGGMGATAWLDTRARPVSWTLCAHPPDLDWNEHEGYVVRPASHFTVREFSTRVGKFVRASHITTHGHWMRSKLEQNTSA